MNEPYFIGMDIGGTKLYAGMVNASGTIVDRVKIATPRQRPALLNAVAATIVTLRRSLPPAGFIQAIGIGIPGIVDIRHTRALITPNSALSNVPLAANLKRKFRVPVFLGNDVNLGLLGEQWQGAARGLKHVIGIFPGTGLGGAAIVNGELLEGKNGAAAEFGHITIIPDGYRCGCGNRGCLEAFVGRWALERDIRAAIKRGEDTCLTEIARKKNNRIKSGAIAAALQSGDQLTARLMTQLARRLGDACVSLRHIFDPELIICGGGVIEACKQTILPVIRARLRQDPFFSRLGRCPVVAAQLGDDAVMLGAVALSQKLLGIELQLSPPQPSLTLNALGQVLLNGKILQRDCYIRADGRIKKRGAKFMQTPQELSNAEIQKICKKKPCRLLIGYPPKHPCHLSAAAEKTLAAAGIAVELDVLDHIINRFNEEKKARALFLRAGEMPAP